MSQIDINLSFSSAIKLTDEGIESLYRSINEKDQTIQKITAEIGRLQNENSQLLKKNRELSELCQLHKQFMLNLSSDHALQNTQKMTIQRQLMSLDIQKMKLLMQKSEEQYVLREKKLKLQAQMETKAIKQKADKIISQKDIDIRQYQTLKDKHIQAMNTEKRSYETLIEEKQEIIDDMKNKCKELQTILRIQSKQIDFDKIKQRVIQIINEFKELKQKIQENEILIQGLLETIKIKNSQ